MKKKIAMLASAVILSSGAVLPDRADSFTFSEWWASCEHENPLEYFNDRETTKYLRSEIIAEDGKEENFELKTKKCHTEDVQPPGWGWRRDPLDLLKT